MKAEKACIIYATKREKHGKSASRKLRTIGKFPAIIYGGNIDPISIVLEHNIIWNVQHNIDFYNEILTIIVDNKKEIVKVQAIQRHVYKPKFTHIDFIRV